VRFTLKAYQVKFPDGDDRTAWIPRKIAGPKPLAFRAKMIDDRQHPVSFEL
jgi:hypothetical protein